MPSPALQPAPLSPSIDELSNLCFGCGPSNPHGLRLRFTIDTAARTATTTFSLDAHYQGAPGFVHGGIIATLLDEAMSKLNRPLGLLAMTRNLAVDYLRPIPIHTTHALTARFLRQEGRKLFHEADITDATGTTLARSSSLWIVVPPETIHALPGQSVEPA